MNEIKRWYDRSPKLSEMMLVMSNMSDNELEKVSKYLYQVVNIFRKQKQSDREVVSIGLDKLFGYYKAYNKRRWYDKNPSLSSAINIMSTMKVQELEEIMEGFIYALRSQGLYKVYSNKRKELAEKGENIK